MLRRTPAHRRERTPTRFINAPVLSSGQHTLVEITKDIQGLLLLLPGVLAVLATREDEMA